MNLHLRQVRRATALSALTLVASVACHAASGAQVRYSSYGIPHVLADDYEHAGYGLGYAFARDNLCVGVELALTLAGERSEAFGEDATYVDPHLGSAPVRNLESDFYAKLIYTDAGVAGMRAQMSAEARALVTGYVSGFNRRLGELPPAQRPSRCRAAEWVRPLTETDTYRRIQHLAVLQSTHVFLTAIAGASPPTGDGAHAPGVDLQLPHFETVGSNMAAFGRQTTANGRGMSFAQPHFPWHGPQRLYAAQLTVPGRYDAFGGLLYGTPFILLGFNRDLGWGITYSTNHRLALYRLNLVAGDPTSYVVDASRRQLDAVHLSVRVRTAAGRPALRTRTLYRSADGPVIDSTAFPWTEEHAYILKDANRNLGRWPDQFLALARARTVREAKEAAARIRGFMYSNIAVADRHGEVLYANFSPAINMPDTDLARCLVEDGEKILRERYIVVLDGSRAACAWRRDGDAVDPEILPARRAPWTIRTDYVLNANDSHWLVNADPGSVLEGFDRVVGSERTARGDRTRTGLRLVERRLAGADGLDGNKMTLESMRRLLYRAETVTGESVRPDAVRDCHSNPAVRLPDGDATVDTTKACDVLGAWDGSARPDSRGAVLAREFLVRLPVEVRSSGMALTAETWRIPFDPTRPLETPAGLTPSATTRRALAEAVQWLEGARLPLDAPLRDVQFLTLNGQHVPVGGFPFTFLRFSAQSQTGRDGELLAYGDAYIHAVTFGDAGPVADIVMPYSQSTDPQSDHSWDLTLAYAQQRWIRLPFLEHDIRNDPGYRLIALNP
jgi:acyl-homoserine-lactone acylase